MSRSIPPFPPIPDDTTRAVSAVFGRGNIYRVIGDQVNSMFSEVDVSALDASGGKSPENTPLLAILIMFQFAEDLPDRRAADALRSRMDWKYALHQPLINPYLEYQKLCKFRSYCIHTSTTAEPLQKLVNRLAARGLFRDGCGQPLKISEILLRVCFISRLEDITETILLALEVLAAYQPELLREKAAPHWYVRYDRQHIPFLMPDTSQAQMELVQTIGEDIVSLLQIMTCKGADRRLLPEVKKLQQILSVHYDNKTGKAIWRPDECAFCGQNGY